MTMACLTELSHSLCHVGFGGVGVKEEENLLLMRVHFISVIGSVTGETLFVCLIARTEYRHTHTHTVAFL